MPPAEKSKNDFAAAPANDSRQWRKLRGYAFDPILSQQFDTSRMNEMVFRVPWEPLKPGPIGEYIELIDYDPASGAYYDPVNLDEASIVGGDGLDPDESNPEFHQQFVYAVAMTTIRNFEQALGRKVFWVQRDPKAAKNKQDKFVEKLRIYPHAFRAVNAYYSPQKKALCFGYFPAVSAPSGVQLPGGLVFSCLSHDVIAHETTHSLLDTVLPRYLDSTNPDVLAFHEAFADLVALFQHFSFPDVLHQQIAKTGGDLASQSILGELALQFGQATGMYGGLREQIGRMGPDGKWEPNKPDPSAYDRTTEPHERGALLVAAVFDAFLTIYRSRVADLLRIATGGSGILPPGSISEDLTNRLAREAAKSAQHLLTICIRALDYCPPVDITFGDYLRALITADVDLVQEDDHHYRVAIIEAFRRRGLYPRDLRTLSEQSLHWPSGDQLDEKGKEAIAVLAKKLRSLPEQVHYHDPRERTFGILQKFREEIHGILSSIIRKDETLLTKLEEITGVALNPKREIDGLEKINNAYAFQVHSVRPVRRRGPGGEEVDNIVLGITQERTLDVDGEKRTMLGGCTLIVDLETFGLRYAIPKPIADRVREKQFRSWVTNPDSNLMLTKVREPIGQLHLSKRR